MLGLVCGPLWYCSETHLIFGLHMIAFPIGGVFRESQTALLALCNSSNAVLQQQGGAYYGEYPYCALGGGVAY